VRTRATSVNIGLPQSRVRWLIEHTASHQLLCWADSFVLPNPPERKARNRCASL